MSTPPEAQAQHSQAAEALEHLQKIKTLFEGQMNQHDTASFTAKDESETVTATIDGDRLLTGLYIEEGSGRLGAEVLEQRINEAIGNAQAEAMAAIEGQQDQMLAALAQMTAGLAKSIGLTP